MKLIGINDSIHSIEVKADFLNAIYTKLLNINIILYKEDKLSQSQSSLPVKFYENNFFRNKNL